MSDRSSITLKELKAERQAHGRPGKALQPLNSQTAHLSRNSIHRELEQQWKEVVSEARFNAAQKHRLNASASALEKENSGSNDQNNNRNDTVEWTSKTLPPRISVDKNFQRWRKEPEGWNLEDAALSLEYMKKEENRLMPAGPPVCVSIRPHMRAVLCDWLIQVQHHLRLLPSTLYLAVQYVDRYVQCESIDLSQYQCLGVAAVFVASKLEERYTAEVTELVYLTDNTFTVGQVVAMEKMILEALDFRLSTPEASWFLRLGVDACPALTDDEKDTTLLRSLYVLDLLMVDEAWAKIAPSFAAASAIALNLEVQEVQYPRNLEHLFGYRAKELRNLMYHMACLVSMSETATLTGCFQKYCSVSQYQALAKGHWVKGSVIQSLAAAHSEPTNSF